MALPITKRNVFLFDGLGALLSAILLGVLLPAIQSHIGIPIFILHTLALIALSFAIYSMMCHFVVKPEEDIWLKMIMVANFSYCLLTLALVICYWSEMTKLGIAYFFGESLILLVIVRIEAQISTARIE